MDSLTIIKIVLILLSALVLWGLYKSGAISFRMSFGNHDEEELRPEVQAFALLMEKRLREKDADKGQSWKNADIGNLQVCITAKNMSLDTALTYGTNNDAARHSVDLANYAMMIADLAGALESPAKEAAA